MKRVTTAVAAATLLAISIPAAHAGPYGTWRMENGKVTVRISDCGGKLCGTIVGLRKPLDKKGKPKRDKHNPNPALRNRPVIGLAIINGLKPDGEGKWEGTIYNPDDGNTYSSRARLINPSLMQVKGCVAFVCKSTSFQKVN